MTSETPGTPALISDCNVTENDVHLQQPVALASAGALVYITYPSSPKIHPVSKQTTNQTLQQGKLNVFISPAVVPMTSHIYHLYRTLKCILKLYPKAGKIYSPLLYFTQLLFHLSGVRYTTTCPGVVMVSAAVAVRACGEKCQCHTVMRPTGNRYHSRLHDRCGG